jgi:hypothetical protein
MDQHESSILRAVAQSEAGSNYCNLCQIYVAKLVRVAQGSAYDGRLPAIVGRYCFDVHLQALLRHPTLPARHKDDVPVPSEPPGAYPQFDLHLKHHVSQQHPHLSATNRIFRPAASSVYYALALLSLLQV